MMLGARKQGIEHGPPHKQLRKRIAYLTLAEQSPYMKSLLKGALDHDVPATDTPRRPGLQDERPSEGLNRVLPKDLQ
eukprot:g23723.t1